jgi:hypothetical protein
LKIDKEKLIRGATWAMLFACPGLLLLILPITRQENKPAAIIFIVNSAAITAMAIMFRMAANGLQKSDDPAWRKIAHHVTWFYNWCPAFIVISWLTLFTLGGWTWRSLVAALAAHLLVRGLYLYKSRRRSMRA